MRYYKLFIVLALVVIILIGLFPHVSAHAEEPSIRISDGTWVVVDVPMTIPMLIARYSAIWGVSETKLRNTLFCESQFKVDAISPTGDYGVAQINLASWPSVTEEEAFNPDFAINFAAKEFAQGNASAWVCYQKLYM